MATFHCGLKQYALRQNKRSVCGSVTEQGMDNQKNQKQLLFQMILSCKLRYFLIYFDWCFYINIKCPNVYFELRICGYSPKTIATYSRNQYRLLIHSAKSVS